MPTYDYRCTTDNTVYSVRHSMNDKAATWQELCALGGMPLGSIDPATPVERILTTGGVLKGGTSKTPSMPPCGMGGCGSGMCQFQ